MPSAISQTSRRLLVNSRLLNSTRDEHTEQTSEILANNLASRTTDAPDAVSAVPEPTTWLMMLIGFAGLGIYGWRRTRLTRATSS